MTSDAKRIFPYDVTRTVIFGITGLFAGKEIGVAEFYKKLSGSQAAYFRQNGGNNHKVATRLLLTQLVGNSVATSCSWAGSQGTKEAFNLQGNILALVLAALKPKFKEADKETVASVAKKWIYSSNDRDGGRNVRRSSKK